MSITPIQMDLAVRALVPLHTCDGCGKQAPQAHEIDRIQRSDAGALEVTDFRTEGWNTIALTGHATLHLCASCSAQAVLASRKAAASVVQAASVTQAATPQNGDAQASASVPGPTAPPATPKKIAKKATEVATSSRPAE